ncbi:MAG TPA: penicillin acylase family protein [Nitrosomonas sp.]|nr:penicillin acylase family protein [Nitrosomonas sp.]
MHTTLQFIRYCLITGVTITVLLISIVGFLLLGSLPHYDGEKASPGLSAPVSIERDSLGTVTFKGQNRLDLAQAMGFVHAQERFFEMDLLRRQAAGELAELFGTSMLMRDIKARKFRLRARSSLVLEQLPETQRQLLDAYRIGVNHGIESLTTRPFPYLLAQKQLTPWKNEDSILVILAMFLTLNESNIFRELKLSTMHAALPESVYRFLTTKNGPWNTLLVEEEISLPNIPPPEDINLQLFNKHASSNDQFYSESIPGSNSFAASGTLTGGSALVANDMHLTLRVPNVWFRSRLIYPSPSVTDTHHDITGINLPGTPSFIIGSNRFVAWSFTNSQGDFADWVRVTIDQNDNTRYLSSTGWKPFEISEERIRVHNAADEVLAVYETEWGPIIAEDHDATPLALAWSALRPEAINLKLIELEHAKNTQEAAKIAQLSGIPVQNFIVGDRDGNILWTLAGRIPARTKNYDPQLPANWSEPDTGWIGWLDSAQYPLISNPASQRLWSANSRLVSNEQLDLLGDGGYDLGARAWQIRDRLMELDHLTVADMQAIQLDNRALLLSNWHELLTKTLQTADGKESWVESVQKALADWDGKASVDSTAYRIVYTYRHQVMKAILNGFAAPIKVLDNSFRMPRLSQAETVVWQLIEHQPMHLLPAEYLSWEDLLLKSAQRTVEKLQKQGNISERTWGMINTARIRHPLSKRLPAWISNWLDMPPDQLPGDHNMPRVQTPTFGASQRSVVIPGKEEQGYFSMPGGQSGHPFSPYYGGGHADWVEGKATPFLPGIAKKQMRLTP